MKGLKGMKGRTQKRRSAKKRLPVNLRSPLPASSSALKQAKVKMLGEEWKQRWRKSPRWPKLNTIDQSLPSKRYLKAVKGLRRGQRSLITQIRTGHIGLNRHLHRITKAPSPDCPHCDGIEETVHHFILECQQYKRERQILRRALGRDADSLAYMLTKESGMKELVKYVNGAGRMNSIACANVHGITCAPLRYCKKYE